ncbi:tetratricopeptide repeat protein [Micromonospora sp. NPDC005220]|uniref:tetratricopeptide repeat protein n=1 Tax=Micromonospora sp. NPDC005220 TaxID=3155589 RepID=UPI00339E54D4
MPAPRPTPKPSDVGVLGPNHPTVAIALGNLAHAFQGLGKSAEALPLQERALAISEAAFGPDHPQVATGLNNLAGTPRTRCGNTCLSDRCGCRSSRWQVAPTSRSPRCRSTSGATTPAGTTSTGWTRATCWRRGGQHGRGADGDQGGGPGGGG